MRPGGRPSGESDVNPTAGIAGLLHKHGFEHDAWVARATEYCFDRARASWITSGRTTRSRR